MPTTMRVPKPISEYYRTLEEIATRGRPGRALIEGETRRAFATLLGAWGKAHDLLLLEEQTITGSRKRPIRLDGVLVDEYRLHRGVWEAKDSGDDLDTAIRAKIDAGYSLQNTLFENTRRAVLYQDGREARNIALTDATALRMLLDEFVEYRPPQIEEINHLVQAVHV